MTIMRKAHFRSRVLSDMSPPHAVELLKMNRSVTSKAPSSRSADWAAHALTLFIAAVFLDSLRFKFTNAPKTQIIFGDLDRWASGLGAPGLFAQGGLFSQYAIGAAELAAAAILVGTMLAKSHRFLQPAGALLSVAIMSGAIGFHLFTPLGVNVDNDGGALFYTACAVWAAAIILLFIRRQESVVLLKRLRALFAPAEK